MVMEKYFVQSIIPNVGASYLVMLTKIIIVNSISYFVRMLVYEVEPVYHKG